MPFVDLAEAIDLPLTQIGRAHAILVQTPVHLLHKPGVSVAKAPGAFKFIVRSG
jgi:hypothetical protein